jgi:hypothetical protein
LGKISAWWAFLIIPIYMLNNVHVHKRANFLIRDLYNIVLLLVWRFLLNRKFLQLKYFFWSFKFKLNLDWEYGCFINGDQYFDDVGFIYWLTCTCIPDVIVSDVLRFRILHL